MTKKHNWRKIKITFSIFFILGLLFLHFYAPRFITEINNPIIEVLRQNHLITTTPTFTNDSLAGKHIIFKSFDGVEISAFLTHSRLDSTKGTIILLHGIRSNKEHFIELSHTLSGIGYNTLALDSRAHGISQGIHCTFGVKEKKDISALIDVLANQENITENIGLWGQSLGGAIGLQAMGNDTRIKFGIIESAFSDFRTITNDYFNYHAGFNIKLLTNYLVYRAGKIADFDPDDAIPIKYCENIKQPILIVHGAKDKRINIDYARDNFEKIPSLNKEFIEIENANHLNVWKVGGSDYFEKVIEFIDNSTFVNNSLVHSGIENN